MKFVIKPTSIYVRGYCLGGCTQCDDCGQYCNRCGENVCNGKIVYV